jgi:hypothetical protein
MKVSCWQNHFLLLRSSPARQAGYAGGVIFPESLKVTFSSTIAPDLTAVHIAQLSPQI